MRNFGDVRTEWLLRREQVALGGIGQLPKRRSGGGFLPPGAAAPPPAPGSKDRAVAIEASPRTPADGSREPAPGVRGTGPAGASRGALLLLALLACLADCSLAAGARPPRRHHARLPAGDCQPYAAAPCLLPFPDNRFTRPDATPATGLRVQLPAGAMPVSRDGERTA